MVIFLFLLQLLIIGVVATVLYSIIQNKTNLSKIHQYIDQKHKDLVSHLKNYDIRVNDLHTSLSLDLKNYKVIKENIDKITLDFDRKLKELSILEKEAIRRIEEINSKEKKLNKSLTQIDKKTTFVQTIDSQINSVEQKINSFYTSVEKMDQVQTSLQDQLNTIAQNSLDKSQKLFAIDLDKLKNSLGEELLKIKDAIKVKFDEVSTLEKKIERDLRERNNNIYSQIQNEVDIFLVEEKKENNEKIKLWLEEMETSIIEVKEKVIEIDQLQSHLTNKQNDISEEIEVHKDQLTDKMNQLSENILQSFQEKVHAYQTQMNSDIEEQYQGFVEKVSVIEGDLVLKEEEFAKHSNDKIESIKQKIADYNLEVKKELTVIHSQYENIQEEIKDKIPERIKNFSQEFDKLTEGLKEIEKIHIDEKEKIARFHQWLEQAKENSNEYLNNFLHFIEDKKQSEISTLQALFQEETKTFKKDALKKLEETLLVDFDKKLESHLSNYEEIIKTSLSNFKEEEERKVIEKVSEIEDITKGKLDNFENELQYIKNLPEMATSQYTSLKEEMASYQQSVSDDINQFSEDKARNFKEKISEYERIFQEQLETKYNDFISKSKEIHSQYEHVEEAIKNKIPQEINVFTKDFGKLQKELQEIEKTYFHEKEKIADFNQWLEEAKENSSGYINNLLAFIEEKKETEINVLQASFKEETTAFKKTALQKLEKTLLSEFDKNLQTHLSNHEEIIKINLRNFKEEEERKIIEKVNEMEDITKAKLDNVERELEYIKNLPETVENQYTELKEGITSYQQSVSEEMNQFSEDKALTFKQKIEEYEKTFQEQLKAQYGDFKDEVDTVQIDFTHFIENLDSKRKQIRVEIDDVERELEYIKNLPETVENQYTELKEGITSYQQSVSEEMNQLSEDKALIFKGKIEEYEKTFTEQLEKRYSDFVSKSKEMKIQYENIKEEIKDKIPHEINVFTKDFGKLRKDLQEIEKTYFHEKEKIADFNQWLEEAKENSSGYINNLLAFIEEKKETEINVLQASFKEETETFKKTALQKLEKTLLSEFDKNLQTHLSNHEEIIKISLRNFKEEEERKIIEKVSKMEDITKAKLDNVERELEYIKNLPETVENQYTELKEGITSYQQSVSEEMNQFSEDKALTFKQKIEEYEKTFTEQLEKRYSDFVSKSKEMKIQYENIKEEIKDKIPHEINVFTKDFGKLQKDLEEIEKTYFHEKEKIADFNQWLEEAKENSSGYINNLLTFIEEKKETEINVLEASFKEETERFKKDTFEKLEKTLLSDFDENLQNHLSNYEKMIESSLSNFKEQEERKVIDKVSEIEGITKSKLDDFESELEYIKNLPETVENQYTQLKEEISSYQQSVSQEINQLSEDKALTFKEKIEEYEKTFQEQLETGYSDFVGKSKEIHSQYRSLEEEIRNKIPEQLENFTQDFDKLEKEMKSIEETYFHGKEEVSEFNRWLEEAKETSGEYLNNFLSFIEEKKQTEINTLQSSFEEETAVFKKDVLEKLEKTLLSDFDENLQSRLSNYEEMIEASLGNFKEQEERKVIDKVSELEDITKSKLGDFENELEYIKNLPETVENQYAELKEEISSYQQSVSDDINQLSKDKLLIFKEKIEEYEKTFQEQLKAQYGDFKDEVDTVQVDFTHFIENLDSKRKQITVEIDNVEENKALSFKEKIEQYEGSFQQQLETHYTDFLEKTEIIKLDIEETKKQFKLHNAYTIRGFKEQIKGHSQTIQNELESINLEYKEIKENLNAKFPQTLASFNRKVSQIQQTVQNLEKNHFNEKEKIKEFHQWLEIAQETSKSYLMQLLQFIEQIKEEKKLEILSLIKTFEKEIKNEHKDQQELLKDDLLKNSEQIINNLKRELLSFLKTKEQPALNYFEQQKETEDIQKRLKTIEVNLEISNQNRKNSPIKVSQKRDKELEEYKKQFSIMKKSFLEKEFLLEKKFQINIEFLNKKYYKQIKVEQKDLSKQKIKINELIQKYEKTLNIHLQETEKTKMQLISDFENIVGKTENEHQSLTTTYNQAMSKAMKELSRFKTDHKKVVVTMTNELKIEIDNIESKWSKNLKSKFTHLNKEINTITEKMDVFLEQSDLFSKVDLLTEKAQMDIKTYQKNIKNIEKKSTVVDNIHKKILEAQNLERKIELLNKQVNLEKQDVNTIKKDLNSIKSLSGSLQKDLAQFDVSKEQIKKYWNNIDKHKDKLESIQKIINNFTTTKTEIVVVTEQIKDIITQNKDLQKSSYKVEQIHKKIDFMEQSYQKINIDKKLLLDFDKRYETFELMLEDLNNREEEVKNLMGSLSTKEEKINDLLNKVTKEVNYYQDILTGKTINKDSLKNAFSTKESQKMSKEDLNKLENTVAGLLKIGWAVKDIAKNLGLDEKIISKIKDNISNK